MYCVKNVASSPNTFNKMLIIFINGHLMHLSIASIIISGAITHIKNNGTIIIYNDIRIIENIYSLI